jgi:hypothetical protein
MYFLAKIVFFKSSFKIGVTLKLEGCSNKVFMLFATLLMTASKHNNISHTLNLTNVKNESLKCITLCYAFKINKTYLS